MKKAAEWLAVVSLLAAAGCARDPSRLASTIQQQQAAPKAASARTWPLFIIERSKNANTVHYDARLTAAGELDPREPVIAYCVMLAEDGRRKELTWIEKKMAYGFDIEPAPSVHGYKMTIAGARDRSITVKKEGNAVRAELVIDGRPAVVEKMYIRASDALVWPKVHYIDLYGQDLLTGEKRFERVMPK